MNTKYNENPGKRLLGFFHIINLLPVGVVENTFFIKTGSVRLPTIRGTAPLPT